MAKENTFMPFFYDWCEPFEALSGEECQQLLLAMVRYHKDGTEPPTFSGMTCMAASFEAKCRSR